MSNYGGYYSDDAPRRRSRRSRRPVYEEKIVESRQGRGQPPLQQALVRRPRSDSSSSIEEIEREFDPESGAYIERQRTVRDRKGDRYGDPRSGRSEADYSRRGRESGGRRRRDSYDSYDSYDSESEDDRRDRRNGRDGRDRKRDKSIGEKALEAVGLGGAAAAIADKVRGRSKSRTRGRDDSRDRSDSRDSRDSYYYSDRRTQSAGPGRKRSNTDGPDKRKKIEDAAKAALAAAAIEAWRSRKNVGGEAGKRILTAAIGAAGIDAVVQQEDRHGNRNALASAIGGLATNRLVNGRSRSRSRHGRRDKTNGDVGTAASVAALAALAGKAIKDQRDRSKSRSRGGGNNGHYDSDADEDSPSEARRKSLSERFYKPTDRVLAKMGLGESENHKSCYYVDRHGRRHYSDDEEDDGPRLRGGGGDSSDSSSSCSTDSYDSDEERDKVKKTRTKSIVTGGLAAVATIHAAHSVYSSMEAREKRHKKVLNGKMTPEEARRLKSRAALQDVAAVGIAALGIKGALSEWKEVKEHAGTISQRNRRWEEMREHREEKRRRGEWDEEVWRRKREQRQNGSHGAAAGGAAGGAGAGAIANGDDDDDYDNDRRGSSTRRPRGNRAIADGRGNDRDYGRGRSQGRRGNNDGYSDDDDYYEYRTTRGYRNSLPPDFSRRKERGAREKYESAGGRNDMDRADGPYYADGNPYQTTSQNYGLRARLPSPPAGYSAAPRY